MSKVRAKKHLGQHFLNDANIAQKIARSLTGHGDYKHVLEIGPGMGALTTHLLELEQFETSVVELDRESIPYLLEHFPSLKGRIIHGNFLKIKLEELFEEPFAIIGNFPYNISSQILFKAIDYRHQVPEVVGMFQKEVAERVAEKPGSKTYGILSVLLQAWYDIEYLFTVNENVFSPPPKVKSAVIRLKRNNVTQLDCDEKLFKQVVKMAFNQRRKTIRNSIKPLLPEGFQHELLQQRPEQLSVDQFVALSAALGK